MKWMEWAPISASTRIESAQMLRGLASLLVCWFHIAAGSNLNSGFWRWSASSGFIGVQIFFVISGFILPYSLWRSGYELRDLPKFLSRRLVRLEPPYLISIVLTLAAGYLATLSPLYRGQAFQVDPVALFCHLGYLNNFVGLPWLQVVYWTLGIELQFYLLIAVLYGALTQCKERFFLVSSIAGLFVQVAVPWDHGSFPRHLAWFLLGLATFRLRRGSLSTSVFWSIFVFSGAAMAYSSSLEATGAGLLAPLLLMRDGKPSWLGRTLGDLSYSLYLVHLPVGGKLANLLSRYVDGPIWGLMAGLASVLASIVAAAALFQFVERPSIRLAAKIEYGTRGPIRARCSVAAD